MGIWVMFSIYEYHFPQVFNSILFACYLFALTLLEILTSLNRIPANLNAVKIHFNERFKSNQPWKWRNQGLEERRRFLYAISVKLNYSTCIMIISCLCWWRKETNFKADILNQTIPFLDLFDAFYNIDHTTNQQIDNT